MGFREKISNALHIAGDLFQDIVLRTVDNRYSVFENSLTIYGYSEDDDCVYLRPNKENALYCVELAQKGNLPETLDIFEKLVESYGYEDNARC
ncbi:MAG TPA: hypothetical protein ENN12_03465, partial [Epsilonproteobacteria bacterium]|nr:hypothetical protein [Campylobacterota bacterium]